MPTPPARRAAARRAPEVTPRAVGPVPAHAAAAEPAAAGPPSEYMTKAEVADRLTIGFRSLDGFRRRTPGFPPPVRFSPRNVKYVRAEVEAWIAAKLAARTG